MYVMHFAGLCLLLTSSADMLSDVVYNICVMPVCSLSAPNATFHERKG